MSDLPQGAGWWKASNGKWYSPKYRPRPPRLKVAKSYAFGAVVLGVGCFGAGVWARGEYDERQADDAVESGTEMGDARIISCASGPSSVEAEVEVTNSFDERSAYAFRLAFDDADGRQIETGVGTIEALDPGQVGAETVTARVEATDVGCRLVDVERLPDP